MGLCFALLCSLVTVHPACRQSNQAQSVALQLCMHLLEAQSSACAEQLLQLCWLGSHVTSVPDAGMDIGSEPSLHPTALLFPPCCSVGVFRRRVSAPSHAAEHSRTQPGLLQLLHLSPMVPFGHFMSSFSHLLLSQTLQSCREWFISASKLSRCSHVFASSTLHRSDCL